MPAELVRCVMAVSDPRRLKLARIAIDGFVAQAYDNKKLVIINALPGGQQRQRVSHLCHRDIAEEIDVVPLKSRVDPLASPLERSGSFMAKLNEAISQEFSDRCLVDTAMIYADRMYGQGWTCHWRDDICHHPFRLAYQMSHRGTSSGVTAGVVRLRCQMRLNIRTANAFYHEDEVGIAGTELVDRFIECGRLVVIDNDGEAAKLSLEFLKTSGDEPDSAVDGCLPGPGCSSLSPADAAYLAVACVPYGLDVRPSGNDAARRTVAAGAATGTP